LRRARDAGWEVLGIDLDENAIDAARKQGLNVRLGDIDILDPNCEQFDIITLSHVIEHVHYPTALLKACHNLTKPGGYIWLETPNIQSQGHKLFKEHWRGLEPPRHLAIFTLDALQNALRAAGFTEIKVQPYSPICADMFMASQAILKGLGPLDSKSDGPSAALLRSAERKARRDARSREFVTLTARKR
jgi:SAM-dependent methyltransferase